MKEQFLNTIIRLSKKSLKYDDVPVGCIIVKNNKIISKGFNTRQKYKKIINHAEINAILKANKKIKSYFLYDCDMYVTLKPCSMCENIIKQSRLRNVYYLLDKPNNKKEYSKTNILKLDSNFETKYCEIMQSFFNKKR